MAFSLGGGKNKKKETASYNQNATQTNTLSPRAAGLLSGGIADLKAKQFEGLDSDRIGDLMDTYGGSVIDASLAQADQTDAEAWNGLKADLAGSDAFGDKRRGVLEAELAGQQSRDRASLIADLNSANYGQASELALQEMLANNQFDAQTQALIVELLRGFGNEGTSTTVGSGNSKGSSSGFNLGFGFTPFGKQ